MAGCIFPLPTHSNTTVEMVLTYFQKWNNLWTGLLLTHEWTMPHSWCTLMTCTFMPFCIQNVPLKASSPLHFSIISVKAVMQPWEVNVTLTDFRAEQWSSLQAGIILSLVGLIPDWSKDTCLCHLVVAAFVQFDSTNKYLIFSLILMTAWVLVLNPPSQWVLMAAFSSLL